MKKILIMFLIALFLTGCNTKNPPDLTQTEVPPSALFSDDPEGASATATLERE